MNTDYRRYYNTTIADIVISDAENINEWFIFNSNTYVAKTPQSSYVFVSKKERLFRNPIYPIYTSNSRYLDNEKPKINDYHEDVVSDVGSNRIAMLYLKIEVESRQIPIILKEVKG